ncbi:MAG TPA: hypothetical protein PKA13_13340 [Geminicoccaceae bacterium]|nr:hypothetical protein [Geminicoccus sp.]HMU50753.1 hypothetical protein [Geminicoccaceae bacterium]
MTDLSIQPPAVFDGSAAVRGATRTAGQAPSRPGAGTDAADLVSGDEALHAAATRAAASLYSDREVEVSSFHDESTGRMVHRIADPYSGQVLMQSPSDELLRFYASSRPAADRPLLAIDA